jgi:ankyrin repeat protein
MYEVLKKLLRISVVFPLFFSGCALSNTSLWTTPVNPCQKIITEESRISFPAYSLSISAPPGDWVMQQDPGQDELVLWVNREDGAIIEIMASRSSRNLSYRNIALEFTYETCEEILKKIPTASCEIIKENEVQYNKRTFYKVHITYQASKSDRGIKSILFLHRTEDVVYHFIFMGESHNLPTEEMMRSIIFLEDSHQKETSTNETFQISLIDACYYGDTEIVRKLLAADTNVNVRNEEGVTALSYASDRGHLDIVEILLANNADVNVKSNVGSTPLINAAHMGHLQIVSLLIANGADVNCQSNEGTTPLMSAAANGYMEIVEILLKSGADVNACEMCGLTAMWNAVTGDHVDIVKTLIDHGADINKKAEDGTTVLMNGAFTGNVDIVKVLLEAGAQVNVKSHNGTTALMIAKKRGHTEIIKLLKQAGAVEDSPKGPTFISRATFKE